MTKNGFEVFEVDGSAEIKDYKTEDGEDIRIDDSQKDENK